MDDQSVCTTQKTWGLEWRLNRNSQRSWSNDSKKSEEEQEVSQINIIWGRIIIINTKTKEAKERNQEVKEAKEGERSCRHLILELWRGVWSWGQEGKKISSTIKASKKIITYHKNPQTISLNWKSRITKATNKPIQRPPTSIK